MSHICTLSPHHIHIFHNQRHFRRLPYLHKPTTTTVLTFSAIPPSTTSSNTTTTTTKKQLVPEEEKEGQDNGGPIELPPSSSSSSTPIFATDDDPSPLQVATSLLLTAAISVFLFRSLRRRAKRAKELRLSRSADSGGDKALKEEALESLKAIGSAPIEPKKDSPTPVQAFLGGISAAVIALILYKFTTTIEAAFNRQSISDNYSVRQITITIRTIVNGLCYLATCVFGVNSIGLFLYSAKLAFTGDSTSEEVKKKSNLQSDTPNESNTSQGDQNADNRQL